MQNKLSHCNIITTVLSSNSQEWIMYYTDYQSHCTRLLLYLLCFSHFSLTKWTRAVKLCRRPRQFHSLLHWILIAFHDICFVMHILIARKVLMDKTRSFFYWGLQHTATLFQVGYLYHSKAEPKRGCANRKTPWLHMSEMCAEEITFRIWCLIWI